MKPIDFILQQPWAMLPDRVETLVAIADRVNESPEAVAAKLGRPLDNTRTVEMRDGVAVIPIRGVISRYATWFSEISGATSVEVLATDFRAALDNPDVRGIVLEIDSPGGQAAGIGELAAQIRAGSKIKPVTAYVSSLGASAAYWLAAAAGKVVIDPTAILGSIGVVQPMSLPRKDDKGPRTIEFVSSQSPNKRPDPETDAGKAEIQRTVDALAQVFIEQVADYRKVKPDDVISRFGGGGVLVGKAAIDAGMADRLGSLESSIDDLMKKARGGRAASSPNPFASGAPVAPSMEANTETHTETPMKFKFSDLFTAWMSKGRPDEIDTADLAAETPAEPPSKATNQSENVDVSTNAPTSPPAGPKPAASPSYEGALAAAREQLKAEMAAELRRGRLSLGGMQAEAYLALHASKFAPADKENLKKGYVAAFMLDAESPIEGYSFLDGFKAVVESRKPGVQTAEIVAGDAKAIGDHLSAHGLSVLNNAATNPDEAAKAKELARLRTMLAGTEEGQAILAEMEKAGTLK